MEAQRPAAAPSEDRNTSVCRVPGSGELKRSLHALLPGLNNVAMSDSARRHSGQWQRRESHRGGAAVRTWQEHSFGASRKGLAHNDRERSNLRLLRCAHIHKQERDSLQLEQQPERNGRQPPIQRLAARPRCRLAGPFGGAKDVVGAQQAHPPCGSRQNQRGGQAAPNIHDAHRSGEARLMPALCTKCRLRAMQTAPYGSQAAREGGGQCVHNCARMLHFRPPFTLRRAHARMR
jgi:hypothetical protein